MRSSRRETEASEVESENPRRVSIDMNLQRQASNGFAKMARLLNSATHASEDSENTAPQSKWSKAGGVAMKSEASQVARRMREAAQLKELQRQPFPIVISRIKHLLEKIYKLKSLVARSSQRSMSPSRSVAHLDRRKSGEIDNIHPSELYRMLGGTSPEPISHTHFSESHQTKLPQSQSESPSLMYRDADGEGSHSGPSSPSIQSLEAMAEELCITFSFVSDFLGSLPTEIRTSLAFHGRVENYKKDQDIYMIGDEPTKFFVILTGQVDVWTHPPGKRRHRSHLDTLRKGQIFGDLALLNDVSRTECCTPSCNCTFLTLDRRSFLQVLGPYFQIKLDSEVRFFKSHSEIFSSTATDDAKYVINKMLITTYKAGKEWEPYLEQQVFFIKSGTCILESHDHKFAAQTVTRAMLGGIGDAPALADEGTLANVLIGEDGRAIGTLGHEEEIRRLRRMLIPKKLLTILGPGSVFGGGQTVMGEGEAQSTLKVLAQSDVQVFHMHMRLFEEHAPPELLRILRDDFSFKLTYYLGRKGEIGPHQVIGHQEALLQCTARESLSEEHNSALAAALASNPAAGLRNLPSGPSSPTKKKKVAKHVHEPGKFSPEVNKALSHIQALKDGYFASDPDMQKHYSQLEQQGVTASETFWCSTHANITNRPATIPPLLSQIFPEGIAPLGDKVEDLVMRTARKTQEVILTTTASLVSSPKSPSKRFNLNQPSSDAAVLDSASQRLDRMRRLSQMTASAPNSPIPPPTMYRVGADKSSPFSEYTTSLDSRGRVLYSASAADAARYSRSKTEDNLPQALTPGSGGPHKGGTRAASARSRGLALTAAGIIWDKQQSNATTPLHRQCFTFEEMSALRRKNENDAAREAEEARRSAMMASIASPFFPRKPSGGFQSGGSVNSPSRKGSMTRDPSVRSSTPLSFSQRFVPDVPLMASSASSIPPHMQKYLSLQSVKAEAQLRSEQGV